MHTTAGHVPLPLFVGTVSIALNRRPGVELSSNSWSVYLSSTLLDTTLGSKGIPGRPPFARSASTRSSIAINFSSSVRDATCHATACFLSVAANARCRRSFPPAAATPTAIMPTTITGNTPAEIALLIGVPPLATDIIAEMPRG